MNEVYLSSGHETQVPNDSDYILYLINTFAITAILYGTHFSVAVVGYLL